MLTSVLWLMSFTVPKGRGQGPACSEDTCKTAGRQASTATGCWAGQACGEQGIQHPPPLPPNIRVLPTHVTMNMPLPPRSRCVWGTLTLAEKYSWPLRGSTVGETPPQSATRTYCLGHHTPEKVWNTTGSEPGLVSVAVGCSGSSTEGSRAQATVRLCLPDASLSAPNTHTHTRQ